MLQKARLLDVPQFNTIEEALDASLEIMRARFSDPDQQAVVLLAEALYSMQERERFEQRGSSDRNVAYGR